MVNINRFHRAGALWAGVILVVGTLGLVCASWLQAATQPRYPVGQEWMNGPPPAGVKSTLVKSGDVAVGLVVADGMQTGQTVSGTMVMISKGGSDTSVADGMVLVDPAGKQHKVEAGKVITFTVGAAAAISLLKGGKTLGSNSIPLGPVEVLPDGPVIAQSERLTNLKGAFDGNAANSAARIGDKPLKVIAESPTQLIVATPNMEELSGPVEIEVMEGGKQTTVPANLVKMNLKAPPRMIIGQRATATLVISGLQGLRKMKNTEQMTQFVHLANETPQTISFIGKRPFIREKITPSKISQDGTYNLRVPLMAIAPGSFRLVGSYVSGIYGCLVTCTGCDDGILCGDNGRVDCSGGTCTRACRHGAGRGGPACGHAWSCDCGQGACVCKQ
ncbi:MAG: hypothetical protein ACYC7E_19735 [Armatimonadota bacterium]